MSKLQKQALRACLKAGFEISESKQTVSKFFSSSSPERLSGLPQPASLTNLSRFMSDAG
jgi:hypothetical protein